MSNTEVKMTNYAEFKSAIKAFGFSVNNFYDVQIGIAAGTRLYRELLQNNNTRLENFSQSKLLRLYTDEASMPGIQMSTGEYRITNSPQLKYAYGAVFSEMNLSFMMDADSNIKNIFDLWTNWIYNYSVGTTGWSSGNRFRANYRDDYAVDINIVKYEKQTSSKLNQKRIVVSDETGTFSNQAILPDSEKIGSRVYGRNQFHKAVPVHITTLFKAFPANIASVPLALGETSMNKLSVGFEYESYTTTAISGIKSSKHVTDAVNGGVNFELPLGANDLLRSIPFGFA